MRLFSCLILLAVFLFPGCAHSPDAVSSLPAASPQSGEVAVASSPEPIRLDLAKASLASGNGGGDGEATGAKEGTGAPSDPAAPSGKPASSDSASADYGDNVDFVEEEGGTAAKAGIADPLEPFNRAMYHFNDKLYFWVLKPVAQGYKAVVPEVARVGVQNFFTNIAFPVRFVNCLLQANIERRNPGGRSFRAQYARGDRGASRSRLASRTSISRNRTRTSGRRWGSTGWGRGSTSTGRSWDLRAPGTRSGLVGDYFTPSVLLLRRSLADHVGAEGLRKGERHLAEDRRLRIAQGSGHRPLRGDPRRLCPVPAQ